jgi:molybdenum cofactor guanylyltransferase
VSDVVGLLLTGGSSARMGRDKAALFSATLAERLTEACGRALEVGPGWTSLATVADPGEGPLAALAAAASRVDGADVVLLACDMPSVSVGLLRDLACRAGTVVPVVAGRAQPLCARYAAADVQRAPEVVAAGGRAMRALLDGADVQWADDLGRPSEFVDVDTPEDLAGLGLEWPRSAGR